MLTSTLDKLTERAFPEVVVAYKKLIGKDLYINSVHTPFVRLLLPILISAQHDDRKVQSVLVPDYKPSSTDQIKAAIYDEKFYELLVNMVRGLPTEKLRAGKYEFNEVRCGTLKLPRQRALIFRANFSIQELLKMG